MFFHVSFLVILLMKSDDGLAVMCASLHIRLFPVEAKSSMLNPFLKAEWNFPLLLFRPAHFHFKGLLGSLSHFHSNSNRTFCKLTVQPRFAATDLGLHCLPMSYKKNAWLIWVNGS